MEQVKKLEKYILIVLKESILEEIIPLLANGMARSFSYKELTLQTIDKIKQNTLVWLYRFLILMYVESRNKELLNSDYYELSLQKLLIEVIQNIDRGDIYSITETILYDRVLGLFKKIHQGDKQFGIFPFFSKIFEDTNGLSYNPFTIPDQIIAESIDLLSRVWIGKQEFPTWVDYSKLPTEYLGNLYESILCFRLCKAEEEMAFVEEERDKRKIKTVIPARKVKKQRFLKLIPRKSLYFVEDNTERKRTGSYFTPEYIVRFITEKTIEPTLKSIKEDFLTHFARLVSLTKFTTEEKLAKLREKDPITRMLNLRILDPAVGSGLFIIAAFRYLSEWAKKLLEESFIIDDSSYVFTPLQFLPDEVIEPSRFVERLILKRCLYGIDLDPFAIELTKISLWLISFMPEYPVVFLNHHFKVGNSLLGLSIENLPNKYKKGLLEDLQNNEIIMSKINSLLNNADLNLEQMAESELICQKIEDYFSERKYALHFYLWALLHSSKKEIKDRKKATIISNSFFRGEVNFYAPVFVNKILTEARREKYFHFELEFWDLFINKRTMKSKAFNFVIANPPFGGKILGHHKNYLSSLYGAHKDTAAHFTRKILSISERYGIILPKTIAFYSKWMEVRKSILIESNIHHIMDTGLAFKDANYETIVLIGDKKKPNKVNISVAQPLRSFYMKKTIIDEGVIPTHLIHLNNIIIFRGITPGELNVLQILMNTSIPINTILESKNNIFRGIYIPDRVKKEVVSKKSYIMPEQDQFTSGKFIWIDKVPHVSKYRIKRYHILTLSHKKHHKQLEKVRKTTVPRIFLKVLRGNRLIGYSDHEGQLSTTEKLVNIVIPPFSKYSLRYICGIINSPYPSFYLANVLFSKTTETSRVMDYPYSSLIPIPQVKFGAPKSYLNRILSLISKEIEKLVKSPEEIIDYLLELSTDYKTHVIHDIIDNLVQKIINTNKSIQLKQYNFINHCLSNYQEIALKLDNGEREEICCKLMELTGKVKWVTLVKELKRTISIPTNKVQELKKIYEEVQAEIIKKFKLVAYLNDLVDELARVSFNLDKKHKEIVLTGLGEKNGSR